MPMCRQCTPRPMAKEDYTSNTVEDAAAYEREQGES